MKKITLFLFVILSLNCFSQVVQDKNKKINDSILPKKLNNFWEFNTMFNPKIPNNHVYGYIVFDKKLILIVM